MNKTALLLALLCGGAALLSSGCSCDDDDVPPPPVTGVTGTITGIGGVGLDLTTLAFTTVVDATTTVVTDANGRFTAPLDPGTYDVLATRPGYEDATEEGLVVAANAPAIELTFEMTALAANTYISSANCAVCHDDYHQTFRQTGHPYKLNKVEGAAPEYPFTSLGFVFDPSSPIPIEDTDDSDPADHWPGTDNSLSTPTSWNDLSYVIGGFAWKARFMDANGFIVTGTNVQYNYATDEMVSYHNNENDKPFNCGNCHTTGWQHYDETVNPDRQDNLPGIDGTFAEQGIGCEACHGAGSTHAQTKLPDDITKRATPRTVADFQDGAYAYGKPISCGECHTRDGERDYPMFESAFDVALATAGKPAVAEGGRIATSGGLVKHHEQFDEIFGIDPDTLDSVRSSGFMATHGDCMTCHDTHLAVVKSDEPGVTQVGVDRSNDACMTCHVASRFDPANNARGSMTGLQCSDCHMPKTAKSAVATTLGNGVVIGDVTSHVFKINVEGDQIAADGFSYPYLGVDWACNICHGNSTSALSPAQISGFSYHPNPATTSPN